MAEGAAAPPDARPAVPATWDVSQIPSQKGKVTIVTGANPGLGYETALHLALRGVHVVLACRSEAKGCEAEANLTKCWNPIQNVDLSNFYNWT